MSVSDSTPTALDVARWMKAELDRQGDLYQEAVVCDIAGKFGDQFTYINENGNPAISRAVLAEFRRLTEPDVVWARGERCWRKRQSYDPDTGRAVE